MAKLEVLQKGNPLLHAYISIHFKAHVSDRVSWIHIANDILCDHIQGWSLLTYDGLSMLECLMLKDNLSNKY